MCDGGVRGDQEVGENLRPGATCRSAAAYSTRGILNLGTGVGDAQHQFTDDLYSKVGSGEYHMIVLDGAGTPEEHEADKPSAYFCAYPLVR